MRQEVQVYVTIKLKGLGQRFFEGSDEGDRQMGFGVVHCFVNTIKYRYGRPQTTGQMGFGVVHCCYYDKI